MGKRKREILTGVEIGTSTVKVVMGEFLPGDVLSIVGFGECPSLKVVKGEIVDANVVQDQLSHALTMAEKACGQEIQDVFLAITGGHIRGVNNVGSTPICSPEGTIGDEDVITAVRNARAYNLPPDKKVLHYVDRRYLVDGSREVVNPCGLVGNRLEAETHIIYGSHNSIETSCRMLADALGFAVADIAFSGMAGGFAAFSPEETEKGGLLIDLGAGVTEYVVFHGAGCYHSGQVTVGCEHVVNDLSLGLRLPMPKARKVLHDLRAFESSALMRPDGRSRLIEVPSLGQTTRHLPVSTVEQVIELRLRELFEVILADLRDNDVLSRLGHGVVLAGGGALIPGIDQLAQDVFGMPVRIGRPRLVNGPEEILSSPRFLTPVGLVRWGRYSLAIGRQMPGFWEQIRDQIRKDRQHVWQLVTRAFRW